MISVGTVLHGSYRIESVLGEGGMGSVYAASHVRLPKRFAIKVLHGDVLKNSSAFARFRREAEISSSLGHPNIIEVQDFNQTDDGQPYIVMEYLEGEDLACFLDREGALGIDRTYTITRALASALAAAHGAGVVHRDLKPQNIFINRKGGEEVVKILDFGISKISGASDIQTKTTATLGTPGYMSPEQARGKSSQADPRSDQFSLGAIVYEMLTGRKAFVSEGDDVYTTIYRVVNDSPAPLEGPKPIVDVVTRALAKNPDERFPDMRAFIDEFARGVGLPDAGINAIAAPATSPPLRKSISLSSASGEAVRTTVDVSRPTRSKAKLIAAVSAVMIIIAGVGGALWHRSQRTPVAVAIAAAPVVAAPHLPEVAPAPAPPPAVKAAAPGAPAQVRIRVTTIPANATLLLNGTPLPESVVEVAKGSPPVTVRVEANGYDPQELTIPTESDQTLSVALAAKRKTAAAKPPKATAVAGTALPGETKPTPASKKSEVDTLEDPYAK